MHIWYVASLGQFGVASTDDPEKDNYYYVVKFTYDTYNIKWGVIISGMIIKMDEWKMLVTLVIL